MNLFYDTAWRRARHVAADLVHGADATLQRMRSADVRVLFEAASPVSLATFRPVLTRLQRDPRLSFWFTTSDASWESRRIYASPEFGDRAVSSDDVRWMKFDLYINTDFWNMTWLPRRPRRVHMFHGVAGKYDLDAPVGIAPVVASFDRLLFPNEDRLGRYALAGLVDPRSPTAALVGFPKVDCLVDGSLDRAAIQRSLGLDPRRPTVLYAPTWSPYSSLHTIGRRVIRALAGENLNVVVKIHDRSFDRGDRASAGLDWQSRMDRICGLWGAHLARQSDASPYLFVADALVTDHSSVAFEYTLLDRPIVVIDCPQLVEKARINPEKVQQLRTGSRVAATTRQTVAAVMESLEHPDALGAERRRVAAAMFHRPGSATARAVQTIYDLIALPTPSPAAVATALSNREARTSHRA